MATTSDATPTPLKSELGDVKIDETPEGQRRPTQLVERDLPKGYINKLTPPTSTSYWRSQSFTPLVNQQLIYDALFGTRILAETLTWRVEAHVYVVNAKPDANFANNGGAVYVVLVHGGSAATGSIVGGGMEYRYTVSVKNPKPEASATKQLPPSNTGIQSGDNWNYPISFSQDMQMFRNNGNDSFTFSAVYEDSVDIHRGQQTGFVNGVSSIRWGIVLDNYPDFYANFPFAALSVFKFNSLSEVTFDCTAAVYSSADNDGTQMAAESRSITVDCRFSTSSA